MFLDTRPQQAPALRLPGLAPQARTGPVSFRLPIRPARGALYWRGQARDELTIRLLVAPRSRVAVDLWWNRRGGLADVQLVFGIYGDAVEFGLLSGNGFDAPHLHRAGFGTLAVNIGVQALQSVCDPSTGVHGVLSNTAEDSLPTARREPLEAARRAFWRRFGLDVAAHGSPPLDYLRGTVGALRVVPNGMIAGQFPRDLDLQEFVATPPAGL